MAIIEFGGGTVFEKEKNRIIKDFLGRTGKIPRPPCFKCKRKVPKLLVDLDPEKDCLTITSSCHGERETMFIPVKKIPYIEKIEIGWAFYPNDHEKERSVVH